MKSVIDWNEVVPKLPKKVRDSLYLEAVTLLSEQDEDEEPKKKKAIHREWGPGKGNLSASGRKFRIMKNAKVKFQEGSKMNLLWSRLKTAKAEEMLAEDIGAISQSAGLRAPDGIWYMWSRRAIEIVE